MRYLKALIWRARWVIIQQDVSEPFESYVVTHSRTDNAYTYTISSHKYMLKVSPNFHQSCSLLLSFAVLNRSRVKQMTREMIEELPDARGKETHHLFAAANVTMCYAIYLSLQSSPIHLRTSPPALSHTSSLYSAHGHVRGLHCFSVFLFSRHFLASSRFMPRETVLVLLRKRKVDKCGTFVYKWEKCSNHFLSVYVKIYRITEAYICISLFLSSTICCRRHIWKDIITSCHGNAVFNYRLSKKTPRVNCVKSTEDQWHDKNKKLSQFLTKKYLQSHHLFASASQGQ